MIFAEIIKSVIFLMNSSGMHGTLNCLIALRRLHQLITMWLGVVILRSALSENTTIGMIRKSPISESNFFIALVWERF